MKFIITTLISLDTLFIPVSLLILYYIYISLTHQPLIVFSCRFHHMVILPLYCCFHRTLYKQSHSRLMQVLLACQCHCSKRSREFLQLFYSNITLFSKKLVLKIFPLNIDLPKLLLELYETYNSN